MKNHTPPKCEVCKEEYATVLMQVDNYTINMLSRSVNMVVPNSNRYCEVCYKERLKQLGFDGKKH